MAKSITLPLSACLTAIAVDGKYFKPEIKSRVIANPAATNFPELKHNITGRRKRPPPRRGGIAVIAALGSAGDWAYSPEMGLARQFFLHP